MYEELLTADSRKITTNHCPNHGFYDINPNTAIATESTYRIPLNPMYNPNEETDLSQQGGGIGVLFDGGFLFSAYGGPTYGHSHHPSHSHHHSDNHSHEDAEDHHHEH